MESANLHHQHQLQDQLVGSSSLATTPSWYGATSSHAWTPNNNNTLNNSDNFNHNINGDLCNSTDSRHKDDHTLVVPPLNSPNIIQDLAFNWTNNNAGMISCFTTAHPAHDHHLHLAKTKDELSLSADFNFPKFTHMINSSPSSSIEDLYHLPPTSYIKDEQNGGFFYNAQNCSRFGGVSILPTRGNFSSHMILPSINVSDLSQSSCPISSSLDMNLQALDLLTSARFGCTTLSQPSHDNLGQLAKESLLFAPHQMQQPVHSRPASSPSKISPFMNGVTEVKRPSRTMMEPKASQAATKKSRLESRACPPFKVRKEKLGDRIATLQQLVAPFGKTDTASVLMEAIGYIKFLQNQVETLSVPYMKSSRNNKTHRSTQPIKVDHQDQGNEEPKRDLKGRGLCLVPLSCMSYVTSDSAGGGIWPDYHGGT